MASSSLSADAAAAANSNIPQPANVLILLMLTCGSSCCVQPGFDGESRFPMPPARRMRLQSAAACAWPSGQVTRFCGFPATKASILSIN